MCLHYGGDAFDTPRSMANGASLNANDPSWPVCTSMFSPKEKNLGSVILKFMRVAPIDDTEGGCCA